MVSRSRVGKPPRILGSPALYSLWCRVVAHVDMSQKNRSGSFEDTGSESSPTEAVEGTEGEGGSTEGSLPEPDPDVQVEVFRTTNRLLAGMVVESILAPEGVSAVIHDRMMHSLPAPMVMSGEFGVAVSEVDAQVALSALRDAKSNGLISDEGEILDGSSE